MTTNKDKNLQYINFFNENYIIEVIGNIYENKDLLNENSWRD